MSKIYCVISHTHWDREWYLSFEQFRMRLVDLIDNLLVILEKEEDFVFHLDAQTVVLEDYLEVRPDKKDILEKHITDGKILVGPWYVQNDFYLSTGESTVRNLLIGSAIAEKFGKCTKAGYAPDQFGNMSQLPQILRGFEIDNFIFGRCCPPISKCECDEKLDYMPTEFIWKGADDSTLLAVHMRYWYNNAQRFSENMDIALAQLKRIDARLSSVGSNKYYLLMNGVDHLEAQENLLPILKNMNEKLENDEIKQTTMIDFLDNIKRNHKENNISLPVYKGELRFGPDWMVLQGTLSSRIYIKQMNDTCEDRLYGTIEPLYAMIAAMGAKELYPTDYIHFLLKRIIQNHAHDSICGCSTDSVNRHIVDRYECIKEIEDDLTDRAMKFIAEHSGLEYGILDDFKIAVANTCAFERTGRIVASLTFPAEEKVKGFKLTGEDGTEIPYHIIKKEVKVIKILDPINLPRNADTDHFEIEFIAENVPAFGVKNYLVQKSATSQIQQAKKDTSKVLENEYLKVQVQENGQVDIFNKETGHTIKDALWFEDTADYGSSYIYMTRENNTPISSKDFGSKSKVVYSTEYRKEIQITTDVKLPKKIASRKNMQRSGVLVTNRIVTTLMLEKDSRTLLVSYEVNNKSEDHRLRMIIKTGLQTEYTYGLASFDLMKRKAGEDFINDERNSDQPNSGFIGLQEGENTIAIINTGLHEYEHLLHKDGRIALTVIRATPVISIQKNVEKIHISEDWIIPENQCIRKMDGQIGLYFAPKNTPVQNAVREMVNYKNPMLYKFTALDRTKLNGGRPVVQDSDIDEIFFRDDAWSHIGKNQKWSLFSLESEGIFLSSVKMAENKKSFVIRLFSLHNTSETAIVNFANKPKAVSKISMDERTVLETLKTDKNKISMKLAPKEICSLSVEF